MARHRPDPTKPIFNIFFDHAHAFEEMYCIAFQVLDHTWADMNASYMDWSNVRASLPYSPFSLSLSLLVSLLCCWPLLLEMLLLLLLG